MGYQVLHPKRLGWLLAILFASHVAAAAQVAGSLSGMVRDSLSRQPVAYASVVLLGRAPSGQVLAGMTADEQGRFVLTNLAAGDFRLQISFMGYATQSQVVHVTAGPGTLAPVLLVPIAQQLGEAVVVGRKPIVDVGLDRLVYHADQDVGTAADVLRKTPLLAVDGAGNVTMRGAANFRVLINNKPSPTLAQNLAQALRSLPADQILSVEVIPTPSARYDGEGTAGIINIILKKGVDRGRAVRLGASGGNRNREATAAFSARKGKLGLSAAAGVGSWYEPDRLERRRLSREGVGTDTLVQRGARQTNGTWYNSNLGIEYDPAEHHSLSLAGLLSGYQASSEQDLSNRFAAPDAGQNQLFTRATTSLASSHSLEATGTYIRTFAQARREWSVLAQYARTNGASGYDFDQFANLTVALARSQADYRERSRGRTPSRELTTQTDFKQPFGEKQTLEIGAKAIFRRTGAVADVEGLTRGQTPDFVLLAGRGTDFNYAQAVQAAYVSYSAGVGKKLTASLGSRAERTALAASFGPGAAAVPSHYVSLLPNGMARYAFSDTSAVRLAYSRRITRPFIDYLNPFVDRSNPQNITYGNPALASEATDSYELSYNTIVKTVTLVLSGSVRHTGNAIEAVRLPTTTAGVTAQTYANVAANTFYQILGYGTTQPLPQWDISGGPNVQYIVRLSPELDIVRRGFTAGISVDTTYRLPHKFTATASFSGALPTPALQGQGAANVNYAVGMKKALLHDQAEIALNLTDPFTGSVPYRSTTTTAAFAEHTEYRAYQQAFRVSVNYHFGQEPSERVRKQVLKDDRK